MATSPHIDDVELFRRRVQQKLVDRFSPSQVPVPGQTSHQKNSNEEKSRESVQLIKKSPYTIQNFVWILAAISAFYFSDIVSVVMYDMRIKRSWFWVGAFALLCHVSVAAFLVIWLSVWKKVDSDNWEMMYPKAVPLATASFIIGGICLSIALWPVWGILTPVILGSLLMGVVVVIAMFG